MANIINGTDTGSGGLITTGDSSDELQLQTAETTAVTITSGQQSAFIAGTAAAPAVTTTGDLNTGIYFPAADNIGFATGGTIRGRWTTDGLCFGSDTAAANALDDYEEGTWTPIDDSGAGLTFGAGTDGIYTKIGRQVTAWARVAYPSTANGSEALIGGLPFTLLDNTPNRAGGMIAYKTESTLATILGSSNDTNFSLRDSTGNGITNATMSAEFIYVAITYNV